MSPSTVKLCEQLLRLAKGMCTACEVWLLEQKAGTQPPIQAAFARHALAKLQGSPDVLRA